MYLKSRLLMPAFAMALSVLCACGERLAVPSAVTEQECEAQQSRCEGIKLQTCTGEGKWQEAASCSEGKECRNAVCEDKPSHCGNGVMEGKEECDGIDFGTQTCKDFNLPDLGSLSCNDNCTVNSSLCPGPRAKSNCGNGTIEHSESCDGSNLNGEDCVSLGYAGGDLGCSGSCNFDTKDCRLE